MPKLNYDCCGKNLLQYKMHLNCSFGLVLATKRSNKDDVGNVFEQAILQETKLTWPNVIILLRMGTQMIQPGQTPGGIWHDAIILPVRVAASKHQAIPKVGPV